jgi:hypothetical protein
MSSLALRQYRIHKSPFAHNYLVLYDDDGKLVKEMHGLAYDPVNERYVGKGRSSDYLRAQDTKGRSEYNLPGQHEKILLHRPGDDLSTEWQTLLDTRDKINSKGLTYIGAGSDMNGPKDWDAPVPDVISGNSNSVNRTLLDALRIPVPSMPHWRPGKRTRFCGRKS